MSCRSTAGGHVSTALARVVTGLSDSEVQHIYHALKREGGHLPPPTEQEMKAWQERQQDMLDRARRMSDTRRDGLREKLFRARSEDLDGPTFYAMSRVEVRARQEVAVRSVEGAIDLAPAGSQRHLYELDAEGLPAKVWYASYGSNLHRDRFLVYIKGGRPEGSSRWYMGCRDVEIPDEDIAIRVPGARPHFALTSRVWNGGIAFIDTAKGETATGLGRAYKVSRGQFEDVVAQENGLTAGQCADIPYAEVFDTGRVVTGSGPYETLLHIGDHDGAPVLTFTAPFSTRDALGRKGDITRKPVGNGTPVKMPVLTNKPSAAYLRMIGSGLAETFGMDEVAQADYLRGCPGGDRWSRREVVHILRTPNPPTTQWTSGGFSYGGSSYGGSSSRGSSSRGSSYEMPKPWTGNSSNGFSGAGSSSESRSGSGSSWRGGSERSDSGWSGHSAWSAGSSASRALAGSGAARGAASKVEVPPLPSSSGRAPVASNERGEFPSVKIYACGEDRERGLKGWQKLLREERESVTYLAEMYERTVTGRDFYNSDESHQRSIEGYQRRHADALARVEELTGKVADAKEQRPERWYPDHLSFAYFHFEKRELEKKIEARTTQMGWYERDLSVVNKANSRRTKNLRSQMSRARKDIEAYTARLTEVEDRLASE